LTKVNWRRPEKVQWALLAYHQRDHLPAALSMAAAEVEAEQDHRSRVEAAIRGYLGQSPAGPMPAILR